MTSGLTFAILAYVAGNSKFSGYLSVPYVPGAGELAIFRGASLPYPMLERPR